MKKILLAITVFSLFSASAAAEKRAGNPDERKGRADNISARHSARELFRRGRIYYMNSDYARAKSFFSGVVALDPGSAEAWHFLGGAKHHLGDYDGAIADYTRAIKLNPRAYHTYHNRALSKHHQNQLGNAIKDYTRSIEINRDYFRSWYYRGLAKFEKGNYRGAIEDLNIFLLMKPMNYRGWYVKGMARYLSGDREGALRDFQRALRISNKVLPPYHKNINPFGVAKKSSVIRKKRDTPAREKTRAKSF